VHGQPQLVVDPEVFRNREYWLKFLPAVSVQKEKPVEEAKEAPDLKVAWRYNELKSEKVLGEIKEGGHKFDNSKVMGSGMSNEPSRLLDKETLIHYRYE
jgi:hypothetical protein